MKTQSQDFGDPRGTAYALGELDPAELSAFEASLESDPELLGEVEAVRATAQLLSGAFAARTAGGFSTEEQAELVRSIHPGKPENVITPARGSFGRIILAAAASVVLLGLCASLLSTGSGSEDALARDKTSAAGERESQPDHAFKVRLLPGEAGKSDDAGQPAVAGNGTTPPLLEEPRTTLPQPFELPATRQDKAGTSIVEGPVAPGKAREGSLASPRSTSGK